MGIRLERTVPAGPTFIPTLDRDQQAVVHHRAGPLLVLAGPGTGKTTTLVEVVVERINAGVDPARILILTFGRKAAAEIRQRLTLRLANVDTVIPSAWTFHGWCFALLNELSAERRVLVTAPEQDELVRDLIQGSLEPGPEQITWPQGLGPAAQTYAFSSQMRDLINRAQERAIDPRLLDVLAAKDERSDWALAARLYQDYLDGLSQRSGVDYSSLITQTCELIEERIGTLDAIHQRYDLVIVDEYQDTDPAQVRLLQAVAGGGAELIAIGDPDQAIYGFRGSDVAGILGFPDAFRQVDGRTPARVISLGTSSRSGPTLLAATRRVIAAMQYAGTGFGAADGLRHRDLAVRAGLVEGEVEVTTHRSALAEARWIAEQLHVEHVEGETPWEDMAVIVRTSAAMGPVVRTLIAFGIPVEVAGDELAIGQHGVVRVLLSALRCAGAPDRSAGIEGLLSSPLIGADPALLRRLGRFLRNRARGENPDAPPPSATALVAAAVLDPTLLAGVPDAIALPAHTLSRLLADARAVLNGPAGVLEAMWLLWSRGSWADELLARSIRGGQEGLVADASLDAVLALFAAAETLTSERKLTGDPLEFVDRIERLQIPGDSRTERGLRGSCVRVLTAHRSKGLEWPVVVVAGVQDGTWPDLRSRGSILEADRLTPDGLAPRAHRKDLLAEERRLFYVAVTRAKRRLLVTAVNSGVAGELPSAFLEELGAPVTAVNYQHAVRPTRLVDLVATLRRELLVGEDVKQREQAARTLAWLSQQRDPSGRPLCPDADPDSWWGSVETSSSPRSIRPIGAPVEMSGSSLSSLLRCPQKWAYEHEARASSAGGTSQMFGSVVHAIAEEITAERIQPTLEAATAMLDQVWDALPFAAGWESARERRAAIRAIERFLSWHTSDRGRRIVGTEVAFKTVIEVGEDSVEVRGSMDRVELDATGRVVIADFKTGKQKPGDKEMDEHPQLGVYQAAVRAGAVDAGATPGGAELIHLRIKEPRGRDDFPAVQSQPPLEEQGAVDEQLDIAIRAIRSEDFAAIPGDDCRFCAFVASCPAHILGQRVVP